MLGKWPKLVGTNLDVELSGPDPSLLTDLAGLDELPAEFIDTDAEEGLYGNTAQLSPMEQTAFENSSYSSPGWRRAQQKGTVQSPHYGGRGPQFIEEAGDPVATSDPAAATYKTGERIFHQKFGYGTISAVSGNKLTVDFEKAGEKRVISTFVERT